MLEMCGFIHVFFVVVSVFFVVDGWPTYISVRRPQTPYYLKLISIVIWSIRTRSDMWTGQHASK